MKPDVRKLASDVVHFEDNSAEQIDVIIYATGYLITFPFFDPGFLRSAIINCHFTITSLRLIIRPVLHRFHSAAGAIMPLAELQARWVAGVLNASLALPTKHAMRNSIARDRRHRRSAMSPPRHTMQVGLLSVQTPHRERNPHESQAVPGICRPIVLPTSDQATAIGR